MTSTNTLYDSLFGIHHDNTDTFLRLADTQKVSYCDFIDTVEKLSSVITACGLIKGDRVLLKAQKSPQALAVYAACIRSGTVLVPLNTAYTNTELDYFITDAKPTLIICDQSEAVDIKKIIKNKNITLLTLNSDGTGSLIDESAKCLHSNSVAPCTNHDLAALLYTSGTTGKSKGAMLTHENLLSNAQSLVNCWQFSESDVLLHALPIFHIHGLFVACNVALLSGCSLNFLPSFELDLVIESLPSATTMMGVPTFYTRLLNDQRFDADLVSHMRLFISGSAPMLEETHTAFEQKTMHRILERYGMTETNMNTSNPYEGERKIGTVGLPLNEISIRVNDNVTGEQLKPHEIGVIQVKGPNVFKGYWNLPNKTAEEFTDDGYFITGDLGFIDDSGYLTIIGRQKDLIISGGYNVYPKEVESVLDEFDAVHESAVIGVVDKDLGERVIAIIVSRKKTPSDERSIIDAVKVKLASYKCPKQIFYVDELPRNTMGKVQKNLLREKFS